MVGNCINDHPLGRNLISVLVLSSLRTSYSNQLGRNPISVLGLPSLINLAAIYSITVLVFTWWISTFQVTMTLEYSLFLTIDSTLLGRAPFFTAWLFLFGSIIHEYIYICKNIIAGLHIGNLIKKSPITKICSCQYFMMFLPILVSINVLHKQHFVLYHTF